ncbi:hypothetical protein CCP3SC15_2540005 [Gammaproteobacteria bacterium]
MQASAELASHDMNFALQSKMNITKMMGEVELGPKNSGQHHRHFPYQLRGTR